MIVNLDGQKFRIEDVLPEEGEHMNRELMQWAIALVSPSIPSITPYTTEKIRLIGALRNLGDIYPVKFAEHRGADNRLTLLVCKQAIELAYYMLTNDISL